MLCTRCNCRGSLSAFSMSMKVPAIVAEAKKALESGMCVVIGLQTTGEVRHALSPQVA